MHSKNTFTYIILFNLYNSLVNRYHYPLEISLKGLCFFPRNLSEFFTSYTKTRTWNLNPSVLISSTCLPFLHSLCFSVLCIPNKPISDSFARTRCWKVPAGHLQVPQICKHRAPLETTTLVQGVLM